VLAIGIGRIGFHELLIGGKRFPIRLQGGGAPPLCDQESA
jgi:hypothetical protein